jgi:predicted metal-binding protein
VGCLKRKNGFCSGKKSACFDKKLSLNEVKELIMMWDSCVLVKLNSDTNGANAILNASVSNVMGVNGSGTS